MGGGGGGGGGSGFEWSRPPLELCVEQMKYVNIYLPTCMSPVPSGTYIKVCGLGTVVCSLGHGMLISVSQEFQTRSTQQSHRLRLHWFGILGAIHMYVDVN